MSLYWEPSNYDAIYFHPPSPHDAALFDRVEFSLYPTAANTDFNIVLNPQSSGTSASAATSAQGAALRANAWNSVTVNLVANGVSTLNEFWLQESKGLNYSAVYVDNVRLLAAAPPGPGSTTPAVSTSGANIAVSVNIAANRKPISALIYGSNFPSATQLNNAPYTVVRSGGNSMSRFNWELDLHNTAFDWFFMNIVGAASASTLPSGNAIDVFVQDARAAGTKSLITANLIGFVPLDQRTKLYSYSLAQYPGQETNECAEALKSDPNALQWCIGDAGNGKRNGNYILNDTLYARTSKIVDASYNVRLLDHLNSLNLFPEFIAMDNEPALWSSTHVDVRPMKLGYDELWNKTRLAASAIKAKYPNAVITGPAAWGWPEYFYSDLDGGVAGPDRAAHGNKDLLAWYLAQVCAYNSANGVRLVDYLDIHFYPQSGIYNSDESAGTAAKRLRAPQSLYTSGYVEESWVNAAINLIPRMKTIIANNCPNTKFAITEFSFGDDSLWSAALATAESLAIFGRESVDMATIWVAPKADSAVENAYKLFLNYDGLKSNVFGDSVSATTSNVSAVPAYAIYNQSLNKLFVFLFNKDSSARSITVSLAGFTSNSATYYSFRPNSPLASRGALTVTQNAFNISLLRWESALVALSSATPVSPTSGAVNAPSPVTVAPAIFSPSFAPSPRAPSPVSPSPSSRSPAPSPSSSSPPSPSPTSVPASPRFSPSPSRASPSSSLTPISPSPIVTPSPLVSPSLLTSSLAPSNPPTMAPIPIVPSSFDSPTSIPEIPSPNAGSSPGSAPSDFPVSSPGFIPVESPIADSPTSSVQAPSPIDAGSSNLGASSSPVTISPSTNVVSPISPVPVRSSATRTPSISIGISAEASLSLVLGALAIISF